MQLSSESFELLHAATDHITLVTVPRRRMLVVDGAGHPLTEGFRIGMETLHAVVERLAVRLAHLRRTGPRHGPLEVDWWPAEKLSLDELVVRFRDRTTWHWEQMAPIPDLALDEDAAAAIDDARQARIRDAELVRVAWFDERPSAQMLHVGPPSTESLTIRRLIDAMAAAHLRPDVRIHEVRLGDPVHVPVAEWRTIVRVPIERPA